ncbi:Protein-like protein [Hapsidospora chrysogenum ATCC 11550]|uniref:Protein-like protein n=1 Tax=Hapsidospora chrysogenum (strain ATCC 11550 / CBS 779.69 / DSM 880 / IAM 14645 / JCM 23072 / IMI 49137) TaxID=857340 RepID=A0A086T6D0_HAPC1|nr:Protein-like protein [Hapsidospora chrysogenum ATCC 11550]
MAEHEHSTIKHNDHLLLDQPLLRLPNELLRKNFRSAHFTIEKDTSAVKTLLKDAATAAVSGLAQPNDVLRNLDSMLARMRGVKRKLEAHAADEARLHDHAEARARHLHALYALRTVDDVKYEEWSRRRLDRLMVDYMLRKGYYGSARQLARENAMEKLVDVDTFEKQGRIRSELLAGKVGEALAWCADNKKELRKMESKLEFMLRFQQYIELVREGTQPKLVEAMAHAKKHLLPYRAQHPREVQQACGLLAVPPRTPASAAYIELYRPRWQELADLFTKTHNSLLSLPDRPLLHVALSSGLSALKTPACHATPAASAGVNSNDHDTATSFSSASSGRGVCPICSVELNELAAHVPYAHHAKSHVQPDLVALPSGRTRSMQTLLEEAKKAGLDKGWVKDMVNDELVHVDELKKVYIT